MSTPMTTAPATLAPVTPPQRRQLPNTCQAVTHTVIIDGHEVCITVNFFTDGTPGEVRVTMWQSENTAANLIFAWSQAISLLLQYGVPLTEVIQEFAGRQFGPCGPTSNPQIPQAKSVLDYVVRWLGLKFLQPATSPNGTT